MKWDVITFDVENGYNKASNVAAVASFLEEAGEKGALFTTGDVLDKE